MDPISSVKNLLFDLGGVLYSIDLNRMFEALAPLREPGTVEIQYTKDSQHDLFYQLDRGEVNEAGFAEGLRTAYQLTGSAEEVMAAWNALLVGVIPGREAALSSWRDRYNLALLSNTNAFHRQVFDPQCQPMFRHMQRCFFSYEMGMRKPEHRIFHAVLDEMGWGPAETLFIDDSHSNIVAAQEVGLQTFWMEKETDFEKLKTALS